ncbi:MAG: protein kinase, partial [Gallionella sp.]|nr:protein kinase [Gallionella sp.]
RIEVRAYACLLEELLDRCDSRPEAVATIAAMKDLQRRCDNAEVSERPLFAEIVRELAGLAA